MSIRVLNATYEVLPTLPQRLAEVEHRHRPSHGNAALVCMVLADKFQDRRGYVDETVPQIAAATGLPEGTVRSILGALHKLGLWVKQGKGNQHSGTRRVPAFLPEHRVPSTRSGEEGASRAKHAERDGEHRVLTDEHRVLVQGASRAQARDTPTSPPVSPTTTSSSSGNARGEPTDDDIIEAHITAHIEWKSLDPVDPIDKPAAFRQWARRKMRESIQSARAGGEDIRERLELDWPTGPPADTTDGDYLLGDEQNLDVPVWERTGQAAV